MAIHIHIYGGDILRPRRPVVVIQSRREREEETLAERRVRQREENCARIRRITDGGGIAGISLPEGFF